MAKVGDAPRFWWISWNSQQDGSFPVYLTENAPAGYRLVTVFEYPPYPGRPEMGTTRECLFEAKDG